jgi:hypothetical protein
MLFSIIRFECQEMQRQNIAFRNKVNQRRLSLTKALAKIEAFCVEMNAKYGLYLNVASPSPIQRMASLVLKMFISLFYINIMNRYMTSVTYRIPDRLRQIVLTKGTEAVEAAVELESAKDLQKWAWYSSSWQEYHTAFLLLFEVFQFPMRREASRIWKCLDFIFAEALHTFPPLQQKGAVPSVQEIVAHRDRKARYLLMMIVEHTRAYQKVKGQKTPVRFKDSMIVVTPQRDGDDSDPKAPLNYAHGEPEPETNARDASISSSGVIHGYVGAQFTMAQPRTEMSGEIGTDPTNDDLHTPDNTASVWAMSSAVFSPWIQYGEPGLAGDSNPMLHTSYSLHPMSTTWNEGSPAAQAEIQGPPDYIDPQMLEIDWVSNHILRSPHCFTNERHRTFGTPYSHH